MDNESSAGGIIVTRVRNEWYVILMRDMKGKWTFPKGLIEAQEDSVKAAMREISEEVGIHNLKLLGKLTPVHYFYYRKGLINKTVQYFLFLSPKKAKPIVQTEEGISEAQWMPLSKAKNIIGYAKTNSPVLEEVVKLVKGYGH